MLKQVSHLAPLNKPVLIISKRSTSKKLIASRLHYLSSRWQGPFISLNCAALNKNLLNSKLFSHKAKAFTSAQKRHPKKFKRANGSTLFLNKLATAPIMVQKKLLRVIKYSKLKRVSSSQPLQVNVQLVCATNANLPAIVNKSTFRANLLNQLAFNVVQLPPLRKRKSNIMLMAKYFAIQMCQKIKLPLFPEFTKRAKKTLLNYRQPKNIRKLKNVVKRSVYRHSTSNYPLNNIIINPFKRRPPKNAIAVSKTTSLPTLPLNLRKFQMQQKKKLLQLSLQQKKYNQKRAAKLLKLTYHQFRALLKKHQIQQS